MKKLFLALFAGAACAVLSASPAVSGIQFSATAYPLGELPSGSGWSYAGTAPVIAAPAGNSGQALLIPAASQVYRSVDTGTGAVEVTLTLRPTFAAGTAQASVLELGTTAISFLRQGDHGVVKVLNEDGGADLTLPISLPLQASGLGAKPVVVRAEITAGTHELTLWVNEAEAIPLPSAGQSAPQSLLISFSTGDGGLTELYSVVVASPDQTATAKPNNGTGGQVSLGAAEPSQTSPSSGELNFIDPKPVAAASGETKTGAGPAPAGRASWLEIYTPRHGGLQPQSSANESKKITQ